MARKPQTRKFKSVAVAMSLTVAMVGAGGLAKWSGIDLPYGDQLATLVGSGIVATHVPVTHDVGPANLQLSYALTAPPASNSGASQQSE
jgi:hypothetical protein